MLAQRTSRIGVMILALSLLIAACSGSSTVDDIGSIATTTSEAASSISSEAPDDAVSPESTDASDDGAADSGTASPSGSGDLSLVPAGETDILGNPAGQGFVEIDGVRYDFILSGVCQKVFGGVQTSGRAADGSDVTVDALIPPETWETDTEAGWSPPYVQIEIGNDSWRAEAGLTHSAAGDNVDLSGDQSSVTSFTNDGSLAAGTAKFFSEFNYDEVETVSGSFELYCP